MDSNEIDNIRPNIDRLLNCNRITDALCLIDNMATAQNDYFVSGQIREIDQTYSYMLEYLTVGTEDPHREKLLSNILSRIYNLTDMLVVNEKTKNFSSMYYDTRRIFRRQIEKKNISALIIIWKEIYRRSLSMSALFADANNNGGVIKNEMNEIETDLFNCIWTSYPVSADNSRILTEFLCANDTPYNTVSRLLSAVGLGSCDFFDENLFRVLCTVYLNYSDKDSVDATGIAAAALFWIVTILYKFRRRKFDSQTVNILSSLEESPYWVSDVRDLYMELVRSRDTERIRNKVQKQIIPDMMAFGREMEKQMKKRDLDPELLSENPEWEEILAGSEVAEKLKELTEMQMEGADVFLGTFEHLKQFAFFNKVANWFLPMNRDSYEIEGLLSENPDMETIVETIQSLPYLCDSDKYSMVLSMKMVSSSHLNMMMEQINAHRQAFGNEKMSADYLTRKDKMKISLRGYTHNVYRLVNLFRRKNEFYNIFTEDINLLESHHLKKFINDDEVLSLTGEFYFRYQYYEDALKAFEALDNLDVVSATLYQKMGFAYQKLDRNDMAVKYFELADLLDGSSRWTQIHLATAYRATGQTDKALDVIGRLENRFGDDVRITLLKAYTLMQSEDYDTASRYFFKANFLSPQDDTILQALAWSQFMNNDYQKASETYDKLIALHPHPEDYLNRGHLSLIDNDIRQAVNYYKLYLEQSGIDRERFYQVIEQDRKYLDKAGVSDNIVWLVADAVTKEHKS